jgi:membrane protease YdiL (CAAX protease family)
VFEFAMKGIGALAFLSDLLFPIWLVVIFRLCKKRGVPPWKAWAVASGFCLAQAHLVGRFVGWNVGFYALVALGLLPSVFAQALPGGGRAAEAFSNPTLALWLFPALLFIGLPAAVLFWFQRDRALTSQSQSA